MKKILGMTLVLTLLLSFISGCSGSNPSVTTAASASENMDKVYTIKLTSADPITTIWMQAMKAACAKIFISTKGKVDIQMYPSGEMLVYDEGIEAVMSDTAVFYFTDPALFADYAPVYKTLGAPYLWPSYTVVEKFMDSDLMKNIRSEVEKAGLHAVTSKFVVGVRNTLANKPINKVEDFKGLKIRVPSATIYTDTFTALETSYTPMAFAETFSAIQTGVLDAVEVTPGNAVGTKMWDAMKTAYYSMTNHMLNVVGLFTGEGYWQSLPEAYRKIIAEEFNSAALTSNKNVADSDAALIQKMVDAKVVLVQIPDLSGFKAKVLPLNKTFAKYDEIAAAVAALSK